MHFSQLINKSLKDNSVIEVLEHYGIDVIYDFDRANENEDDLYWAAAQNIGFQLRFNKEQKLDLISIYFIEKEGFTPINPNLVDVPIYKTYDEAHVGAMSKEIPFKSSPGEHGLETNKNWIKLDCREYFIQYQFRGGALSMIFLTSKII